MNRYWPQRNWGARILEYRYKGMRAVFLENEVLRVGVLAEKGPDVFEFNYKPRDMDFVWLTAGGVRNPTSYLAVDNGTALPIAPREKRRLSLRTEVLERGQEGGGGR